MGKKNFWTSAIATISRTEEETKLSPTNKMTRSFRIKNNDLDASFDGTPIRRQYSLRTKKENTRRLYSYDCVNNIHEINKLERKSVQATIRKQENVPLYSTPKKVHSYQMLASVVTNNSGQNTDNKLQYKSLNVLHKIHISKKCLFDESTTSCIEEIPDNVKLVGNIKNKISNYKTVISECDKTNHGIFYDDKGNAINQNGRCASKRVNNEDRFAINLYGRINSKYWQKSTIKNDETINNKFIIKQTKEMPSKEIVTPTAMEIFTRMEKCNNFKNIVEQQESDRINAIEQSSFEIIEFQRLQKSLNIQCNYMNQTSKALELYKKLDKPLNNELEQTYVHAERILLQATCKYEAILNEIRSKSYETSKNYVNLETIEINNITLLTEQQVSGEWYVCVISHLDKVYVTNAIQAIPNQCFMAFCDKMKFADVDLESTISVKLFVIKPMLNKKSSDLKKIRKIAYMDLQCDKLVENFIYQPEFQLCGELDIKSKDLKHNRVFLCKNAESYIKIDAHIYTNSCFVTTGTETDAKIIWCKKWCRLNENVLEFWNDPDQVGVGEPENILELLKCTDAIKKISSQDCSKSKTLVLITSDNLDKKSKTYLNFGSRSEMQMWKNNLNKIYENLHN